MARGSLVGRAAPWLIALGVALAAPGAASAQSPAASGADPFVLKPIGPGVYAAIDGPEGKSGSNAGVIIGDDGVAVVDSFFDPESTKALVAEIRKLTPRPIRYVVNTHYHIDHVGGDGVLREAGAIIIAHRNVRGWERTENLHLFGDRLKPEQKTQIEALVQPDLVTDKDLTIWLGTRRIDVRAVEGHTGSDLVISVPDAHVLFCGDMLWRKIPPNIIDGTVSKWIATVNGFQALPRASEMVFVPGHGDVAKLADVADFSAYLTDLTTITAEERKAGLSGADLTKAVVPKLKARHPDWDAIDRAAPREVPYMDAELAGTKRVPQPTGE
ncbi:MAG: MBL fold metallo-hydrolase [Aliidongia sp.]